MPGRPPPFPQAGQAPSTPPPFAPLPQIAQTDQMLDQPTAVFGGGGGRHGPTVAGASEEEDFAMADEMPETSFEDRSAHAPACLGPTPFRVPPPPFEAPQTASQVTPGPRAPSRPAQRVCDPSQSESCDGGGGPGSRGWGAGAR